MHAKIYWMTNSITKNSTEKHQNVHPKQRVHTSVEFSDYTFIWIATTTKMWQNATKVWRKFNNMYQKVKVERTKETPRQMWELLCQAATVECDISLSDISMTFGKAKLYWKAAVIFEWASSRWQASFNVNIGSQWACWIAATWYQRANGKLRFSSVFIEGVWYAAMGYNYNIIYIRNL